MEAVKRVAKLLRSFNPDMPMGEGMKAEFLSLREQFEQEAEGFGSMRVAAKHPHYHKNVQHIDWLDVYRVLQLFNVADPCLQHAVKKLLVAGGRGAGKDIGRDVQEAIDSLVRWQEMRAENDSGTVGRDRYQP